MPKRLRERGMWGQPSPSPRTLCLLGLGTGRTTRLPGLWEGTPVAPVSRCQARAPSETDQHQHLPLGPVPRAPDRSGFSPSLSPLPGCSLCPQRGLPLGTTSAFRARPSARCRPALQPSCPLAKKPQLGEGQGAGHPPVLSCGRTLVAELGPHPLPMRAQTQVRLPPRQPEEPLGQHTGPRERQESPGHGPCLPWLPVTLSCPLSSHWACFPMCSARPGPATPRWPTRVNFVSAKPPRR